MTATVLPDVETKKWMLSDLSFHPLNPRHIDQDDPAVVEMAESIEQNGLLQLPCVTEDGVVIAGEKRVRALIRLKVKAVDCIVKRGAAAHEFVLALIAANRDSEKPNAIAEAATITQLRKDGCTMEMICEKLQVGRRWVAQRETLVNLSQKIRKAYEAREKFIAHFTPDMLAALSVLSVEQQDAYLPQWVGGFSDLERMKSASDVEKMAAATTRLLGKAPWDLDDATLLPKMGACSACPQQTASSPDLFGDENPGGDVKKARCRLADCYSEKLALTIVRRNEEQRAKDEKAVIVVDPSLHHLVHEKLDAARKGSVVMDYDVEKVAKGTKGAVEATTVSAAGVVGSTWVKVKHVAGLREPPKSKAADVPANEKSAGERLAASVLQTGRRRRAAVVDKVLAAIKNLPSSEFSTDEKARDFLDNLLVAYGADSRFDEDRIDHADVDARRKLVVRAAKPGVWIDVMWARIQPSIIDDLRRTNPSLIDQEYETAEWLCAGLSIGFEKFVDDAEKDIPDPKSWDRLRKEVDGVGKKAAKAKTVKKEKPAKKAKKGRK